MAFAIKRPTSSNWERLNICAVSPNTHLCLGHWTPDTGQLTHSWIGFNQVTKDTRSSLQSTISEKQTKLHNFPPFSTIFSNKWAGNTSVYSMKSMFWTNEKLSFMVAWSSSVSISCPKVQSSFGHLVFYSGNSIVSGKNFWCPCEQKYCCHKKTLTASLKNRK